MSKLILVVEDDADILLSFAEVLGSAGYAVATAANGSEACERLRTGPRPDLILLDLMMPVMDGWEFRQRQLREPAWRLIPVVVVSAGGNVEQKARNLGAVGWLKKPVDITVLLEAIQSGLGQVA